MIGDLERQTTIDRKSIQTIRRVVECSGDTILGDQVINDLTVLWDPGAAGKVLSLPDSRNRTGIEVTVVNVSTYSGDIEVDGAMLTVLPAGISMKVLWTPSGWRVLRDLYAPVSGEESIGTPVYFNDTTARTISDVSLSTTWEAADFSSYVPVDSKGLIVSMDVDAAGSAGLIFCWSTETVSTTIEKYSDGQALMLEGKRIMVPISIKTITPGVFYYGEYDPIVWAVVSIRLRLIGYYI